MCAVWSFLLPPSPGSTSVLLLAFDDRNFRIPAVDAGWNLEESDLKPQDAPISPCTPPRREKMSSLLLSVLLFFCNFHSRREGHAQGTLREKMKRGKRKEIAFAVKRWRRRSLAGQSAPFLKGSPSFLPHPTARADFLAVLHVRQLAQFVLP